MARAATFYSVGQSGKARGGREKPAAEIRIGISLATSRPSAPAVSLRISHSSTSLLYLAPPPDAASGSGVPYGMRQNLIRRMKKGVHQYDPAQNPRALDDWRHFLQMVAVDSLKFTLGRPVREAVILFSGGPTGIDKEALEDQGKGPRKK